MTNSTVEIIDQPSRASEIWRSLWRTHFYAGLIAGPVMVWLALSGLGILYKQPLQHFIHRDALTVAIGSQQATLERQVHNALTTFPKDSFAYVTPGATERDATEVGLSEPDGETRIVWTNPYSGDITGSMIAGKDLPGFFNSYHGSLLPRSILMSVPNAEWLFGNQPFWRQVEVGEVLLEVFAGWGLVLALSGLFLWWPRPGSPVRWLPSRARTGRRRWRDLHTFAGVFLAGFLMFSVVSGLPWASFWGSSWQTLASHITPNQENFWSDAAPSSKTPRLGDMTRFGTPVAWAMQSDTPAPSQQPTPSMPGMHHGDKGSMVTSSEGLPARVITLDQVQTAMTQDGMMPNATIYAPSNSVDKGSLTLGSYVVFNPWPSSIGQQGATYFDEFTGRKLGESTAEQWGALQWVTEFGVQTHMGTQFGIWTRLLMTAGCLIVIWNFGTALMMWNKRRRGTLGIPRRPSRPHIERPVGLAMLALAIFYPLWGASLVLILVVDRFIVQRRPRLRSFFGMPVERLGE